MNNVILSPSLLAADFTCLAEEIDALQKAGISWLHLDIMDGNFVPNISFGAPIVSALRKRSSLFFDVHLMVDNPGRYLETFARAGADLLVIHREASVHPVRDLQKIHELGLYSGIALNPGTGLDSIRWLLPSVDLVLIMGVNPGFSGQNFIPATTSKVRACSAMLNELGVDKTIIEVDGGINLANAAELVSAGADVLVSGSAFFSGGNYKMGREEFGAFQSSSSALENALGWHARKN